MRRKADFLLLVASLAIAIAIWFQVSPMFDNNKEREIDVPLETTGLADGLWLVSPPSTVKVIASGTTSELDRLNDRGITASVDLTRAVAKPFDARVIVNAPAGTPITFKPKSSLIRLQIEKLVQKEQRVEVQTTGLPPSGFIFDGASVNPQRVKISGPSSIMSQVVAARVILNLADLHSGSPIPGKIEILDVAHIRLPYVKSEPETVTINPAIVAAPASRRFLITPNWTGQPAFGFAVTRYEIRPQQVRIRGESSRLSAITSIDTEQIDLANARADLTLNVRLKVPPGMNADAEMVKVVVKISPVPPATPPEP